MNNAIYLLAIVVYNKVYADLLLEDLKEYSDKEKREALASLKEQARAIALSYEQKQWLTSNTSC